MFILRIIFFTLLLPGTVTVTVPYLTILRGREIGGPDHLWWAWLGLLPLAAGAMVLFRCIWDFAATGRGTLAPVDPPKQLVVSGLYRYVRNPMYVGVVNILLGEACLFVSLKMLLYAMVAFAIVNVFVIFYEEPTLRRQFGESYDHYTRTVNRWWPRKPKE